MIDETYKSRLDDKFESRKNNVYLKYLESHYEHADLTSKICVQIPDFCDPETIPTMLSCIQTAVNPDRIYFSVCYQGDDEKELMRIQSFKNCKVVHFDKKDAPGLCAARYYCTKITENVDYVFHIDSHMRFAEFWDVAIIQQWKDCNDPQAIISAYGLDCSHDFDDIVSDDRLPADYNGKYINASHFDPDGSMKKLRFVPYYKFGNSSTPRKGPFIGGHCAFMPLHIDKTVMSDPDMWFVADEIAMAARYWTHGYNIYQFGIRFIYHIYDRVNRTKNKYGTYDRFNHDSSLSDGQKREAKRLRKLFRVENDANVDLTGFDLGSARTLVEYEEFAGINFKNSIITKYAARKAFDEPHSIDDHAHVDWSEYAAKFNRLYGDCEKYKHQTIAVMLYVRHRDSVKIVENLSALAAYPNRLHFYIICDKGEQGRLYLLDNDSKYNVVIKDIAEYKGYQYAYNLLGELCNNEDYAMYLSADAKPLDNWDIYYVNAVQKLGNNAVISESLTDNRSDNCDFISVAGVSDICSNTIKSCVNHEFNCYCKRGAFVNFDFLFMSGAVIKKCNFDPYLTDSDAQFSYSVRLWTHGYDLYNLNKLYFDIRDRSVVSTADSQRAFDFCKSSKQRVSMLLDDCKNCELAVFGRGNNRTVSSFESYIGVNFKDHKVSLNSIFGKFGADQIMSLSKLFTLSVLKDALLKNNSQSIDKFLNLGLHSDSFIEFICTGLDVNSEDAAYVNALVNMFKVFSSKFDNEQGIQKFSYYTIRDVLEIMFKGKELRDALNKCCDILNKPVLNATGKVDKAVGGVYFNVNNSTDIPNKKNRPLLAISSCDIKNVLTIRTNNVEYRWSLLASKVIRKSKAKIVFVTGSDGKTTTKSIISEILKLDCDEHERFLCSVGNENAPSQSYEDAGVDFDNVKYYVKELGLGGKTDMLSGYSKKFSPDVSVVINIGETNHFEGGYHSKEDVFNSKIKIIDGLKPDGVLIINKDDEMLRSASYSCNVISVGIYDKTADYSCKDIVEDNDHIVFTAICPDREIKNVVLNVHGQHNIYGALIGIAIADRFCVSDDKIIKGLANFKYDGTRQTIYTTYKNNLVIYDCFGCSVESDVTMLKSLMSLKVPDGARHIAYLGHMATTGKYADRLHRKLADIIAKNFDLDLLICYGDKSKYFCEEYLRVGKKAVFFNDDIEAMCYIRNELHENDAILVKGCGSYHFGNTFKNCINNDNLTVPVYKGLYADNNEFHGVSKSMLCQNINTGEVYVDKYADVKRIAYHVSILFVIAALCDIYADRLQERVSIDIDTAFLTLKYYNSAGTNKALVKQVVSCINKSKQYSFAELLRIALDYTALDIVYFLIERVGRTFFKNYFYEFLSKLGCTDTVIIDPQSYDISENATTANDLYKVIKHFVSSSAFDDIMNIDSDQFLPKYMHLQKSRLIRSCDEYDEQDTYCENILFAKKIYDLKNASCAAVAKVGDTYLACIALDRALVYTNHASEVDVSRMVKAYKCIVEANVVE